MVSPEKIQELRAVVNFWKARVDETKYQLRKLLAKQAEVAPDDRCGQSIMITLVDMKTREVADSNRGLRRAQANLGRAVELTVAVTQSGGLSGMSEAPCPLPAMSITEFKSGASLHRRSA